MADKKVELQDVNGNRALPVTSDKCVEMSDGSGNLTEKLLMLSKYPGFAGIVTPETNPGVPDGNVFYIAGEGMYPNFSGLTIDVGQLGILKYNGTWKKEVLEIGTGGGNMILEWKTDVATTRKQVLAKYRKAGIQISYKEPKKGWINEQYIGTAVDDTNWAKDSNWEQIPNATTERKIEAEISTKANKDLGKNLFDISTAYKGMFYDSKGNLADSVGYYASTFIEVEEDTDYFLSNSSIGGAAKCLYLDKNANIIQTFTQGLAHSPIGAKYALLSINSVKNKAQFEKGSVATDFEPYIASKTLDKASTQAQYGYNAYLAVMDKGSEWKDGYYRNNGTIENNPAYQYKKFQITKGTKRISTNAVTKGAYFVMFRSEGDVIRTFTPDTSVAKLTEYEIDPETTILGVSNNKSNVDFVFIGATAIDVSKELNKMNETIAETSHNAEAGSLAYKAFATDIVWTKGTNYNDRGEIDKNYAWESARVKAGTSKIRFNFCISGGKLVFFNEEGGVISTYTKRDNDFVELDVPKECVEIGLTNQWTAQPNPQIEGIGISRTIKEVDKDIEYLKGKTANIEEQIIYTVFGDSISTDEIVPKDNSHADGLAYPRTLAKMINAKLDRYTIPGSGVQALKINSLKSSKDASLVTCAYGINDVGKIESRQMTLGDIETIMSVELSTLADNETFLGVYRYSLESLKKRLTNQNALICCISPVTNYIYDKPDASIKNEILINMRKAIKEFVMREGGPNAGWYFIEGTEILPYDPLYFIGTNNAPDSTHPNSMGEAIMAKGIFNRLPNIQLFVNRK